MNNLIIKKSFLDVEVDNVFVQDIVNEMLSVESKLEEYIVNARGKVCLVLESGLSDKIAQMLYKSRARKYIIVPNIDEEKYKKLNGSIIAREVDHIKGNYAIIDSEVLLYFDDLLYGYIFTSPKLIDSLQNIFLKEFWENGQTEYIDSKKTCADVTFDISPIHSNDSFLLDESFENKTSIEKLLDTADAYALTDKINDDKGKVIYIKNAKVNENYLKTTNNEVYLAKDLPCCIAIKNNDKYLLNFDISQYFSLPEKGKGRLFAFKDNNISMGTIYKFFRHITVADIIGKDILNVKGETLIIENKKEKRISIESDLRMKSLYKEMDEETLEASVDKKRPGSFNFDYAANVEFIIEIGVIKHKIVNKANIYYDYENINKDIRNKLEEIKQKAIMLKEKNILKSDIFNQKEVVKIDDYKKTILEINKIIAKLNNDSDIDESLKEIVSNKEKNKSLVQNILERKLSMNKPLYGTLYQDKGKYEYVLKGEEYLTKAIEEMKEAGIENANVLYLLE